MAQSVFTENKSMSLNDNIKALMDSNLSKASKSRALVEVLGLTKVEAAYFMASLPVTHRERRDKFIYRFGVELEMLCNRRQVEAGLNRDGVAYRWDGCYYHSNGNSSFEFKSDGSICSDAATPAGHHPIEAVSPVLSSNGGLKAVEALCKVLNETGARVNITTGFHVHLSTEGMTDEWYIRVFKNYQALESLIDSFMAPSRRDNHYCQSLRNVNLSYCRTIRDVQARMNRCRYFKVNAMAWDMHQTIEFRHHQGTTDFQKISMWLSFCSKLVEYSKTQEIQGVTSIDEIPFLTAKEKEFFNQRAAHFAQVAA